MRAQTVIDLVTLCAAVAAVAAPIVAAAAVTRSTELSKWLVERELATTWSAMDAFSTSDVRLREIERLFYQAPPPSQADVGALCRELSDLATAACSRADAALQFCDSAERSRALIYMSICLANYTDHVCKLGRWIESAYQDGALKRDVHRDFIDEWHRRQFEQDGTNWPATQFQHLVELRRVTSEYVVDLRASVAWLPIGWKERRQRMVAARKADEARFPVGTLPTVKLRERAPVPLGSDAAVTPPEAK